MQIICAYTQCTKSHTIHTFYMEKRSVNCIWIERETKKAVRVVEAKQIQRNDTQIMDKHKWHDIEMCARTVQQPYNHLLIKICGKIEHECDHDMCVHYARHAVLGKMTKNPDLPKDQTKRTSQLTKKYSRQNSRNTLCTEKLVCLAQLSNPCRSIANR